MWRAALLVLAITAAAWSAGGIVAGAVVAGLGTYFVARRSTSGSASKSDAATLFMELRENRRELIDRVHELEAENRTFRERIAVGEDRERALRERVAVLENEVRRLGGKIID